MCVHLYQLFNCLSALNENTFPSLTRTYIGALQVAVDGEEELPSCDLSQLEACLQRCTDNVCSVYSKLQLDINVGTT